MTISNKEQTGILWSDKERTVQTSKAIWKTSLFFLNINPSQMEWISGGTKITSLQQNSWFSVQVNWLVYCFLLSSSVMLVCFYFILSVQLEKNISQYTTVSPWICYQSMVLFLYVFWNPLPATDSKSTSSEKKVTHHFLYFLSNFVPVSSDLSDCLLWDLYLKKPPFC